MTTTEDRARAAMRAIAGTVHDAPPLQLAAARDLTRAPDAVRAGGHGSRRLGLRLPRGGTRQATRGGGRRRRWSVLAPVAAAVTIVAVAVTLAIIRDIPNGGVAGPATATPVTGASAASGAPAPGVPEYYVAWMQADTPYLVVGNTFTGQTIATVGAPAGVSLEAVYGAAADDRTFIVTGDRSRGANAGTVWYLLRIAPGSAKPARLTPLPVPVRQSPAGTALSPDGTELAVALPGTPATLRVYSVATGALLRDWSTTASGELTAEKVTPGSRQFTALVLRWSADGSQLAFAWNASTIRVLDPNAPDGDLITSSRLLSWIGLAYASQANFTCDAAQGWQPITIAEGSAAGQGIVCAGNTQSDTYTPCSSQTKSTCKSTQRTTIGFLRATHTGRGDSYMGLDSGSACNSRAEPVNGAYLGWSNPDGSEVLGSLVCGGHSRFGIFRGSKFTPLPALPDSRPVPAGVPDGTFAW
ncbi:MAG TPA: hypothetical protein VGG83_12830 [Trebonia sp.]|jgi:hypothetical protein